MTLLLLDRHGDFTAQVLSRGLGMNFPACTWSTSWLQLWFQWLQAQFISSCVEAKLSECRDARGLGPWKLRPRLKGRWEKIGHRVGGACRGLHESA